MKRKVRNEDIAYLSRVKLCLRLRSRELPRELPALREADLNF